jgi:hypothetical protein
LNCEKDAQPVINGNFTVLIIMGVKKAI